jgi:RNA polymerase sigma-70 factor (ECF subfamily)
VEVVIGAPLGYFGAMLSERTPEAGGAISSRSGDDPALVAAIAAGDQEALGLLYDHHAPKLLGLARRMLGDQAAAEDLLHDVFLEVWQHAAEYAPARGSVAAWLTIRTRSRALDRIGRGARQAVAVERAAGELAGAADLPASAALDGARLRDLVARLPGELVTILELAYFEGLSASEVAARVGIPIGTVKSRMARALSLLREALAPREAVRS